MEKKHEHKQHEDPEEEFFGSMLRRHNLIKTEKEDKDPEGDKDPEEGKKDPEEGKSPEGDKDPEEGK